METLSVDNTIETIEDVGNIGVDAIDLYRATVDKDPIDIGKAIVSLITNGIDAISESNEVLPELADLDQEEAGKVGAAAYAAIKKIVEKARGK